MVVGLGALDTPAEAAFPGENGRLACEGIYGPEAREDGTPLPGFARAEVFTVNPDGTDVRVLTNNTVRDGDPGFSPDGSLIAFESFRAGVDAGDPLGFSEAFRMNSDGTNVLRLTQSGRNEDRSTNFSPDGAKIAFHSTRDSARSGGDVPEGSNPFEIYTMDADGSNQTRITNNRFQDSFPSYSPDGTRLAFTTNRDEDFEIYTMNPDGTGVERVTNSPGEDAHPTWSPDGTQITFHSRRDGGLEIFRIDADGSNPVRVTQEGGFKFFPVWSPDGTRIAFNGNLDAAPQDFEVYHVDAEDGSDPVRVTSKPGFDGRCDWAAIPAQVQPPTPTPVPTPVASCPVEGAPGYLNPAKLRVSRARVLKEDRRLDVLAPITARAEGDVAVTYQGDNRTDTFDADVSEANSELDEIRILEPITRGQARLGTGIVNLNYLGDEDTRPQFVRLRAAANRAELDVEEISLTTREGTTIRAEPRLSANGSVTDRAEGVVRLRFSYVNPDGSPQVHEAQAEIGDDGAWELEGDQVPAELARCGGYLSIQFTGYFERRIRGEQLAYELNAGQTRNP